LTKYDSAENITTANIRENNNKFVIKVLMFIPKILLIEPWFEKFFTNKKLTNTPSPRPAAQAIRSE
jgi:hypothetical protein